MNALDIMSAIFDSITLALFSPLFFFLYYPLLITALLIIIAMAVGFVQMQKLNRIFPKRLFVYSGIGFCFLLIPSSLVVIFHNENWPPGSRPLLNEVMSPSLILNGFLIIVAAVKENGRRLFISSLGIFLLLSGYAIFFLATQWF